MRIGRGAAAITGTVVAGAVVVALALAGVFGGSDGGGTASAHVVENASDVAVRVDRNRLEPAKVLGMDLASDLAVIQIDPGALDAKPLQLGDSKNVQVGDSVVAIGNPFGLEDTITAGIVSAKQRQITAPNGVTIDHAIQTDAAVNPGNSGGPLIDAAGKVIGVNSQIATAGSKGNIGIAFAIPADTVKRISSQLIAHGKVQHAFLGVSAVTLTPQLASQLGYGVQHGALVTAVRSGSPADRAGLRSGSSNPSVISPGSDVIVAVDGKPIASSDDLINAIVKRKPGDTVKIDYVHGGSRHSASVKLASRPSGG